METGSRKRIETNSDLKIRLGGGCRAGLENSLPGSVDINFKLLLCELKPAPQQDAAGSMDTFKKIICPAGCTIFLHKLPLHKR
jgi:hypothetical protein